MTDLLKRQQEFTRLLPLLFNYIHSCGYEFTLGDAYRDPRCPYGHPRSLHGKKLAIDLNVFKDSEYLIYSNDHKPFGEFWESIGGSWGGRFNDGNHYSLSYKGMR